MGKINKLVLSVGSNFNPKENIQRAAEKLRVLFDSIYFSEAIYTRPIGDYPEDKPFLNQVAIVDTSIQTPEEVNKCLKEIEYILGRRKDDKINGLIPIDIDLLSWNEEILKPIDMEREYIISALRFLEREYDERSRN